MNLVIFSFAQSGGRTKLACIWGVRFSGFLFSGFNINQSFILDVVFHLALQLLQHLRTLKIELPSLQMRKS